MNERTARLRAASLDAEPRLDPERALLLTDFMKAEQGHHSTPVLRALAFKYLCAHKTLYLGEEELIVGERGPGPKQVPTFPELTCHSLEDLDILDQRPKTAYRVSDVCRKAYAEVIIPFWKGRSLREQLFNLMDEEWKTAYDAGIFTEFMEQRAPGHTVLDGKIYQRGLMEAWAQAQTRLQGLDQDDPDAFEQREALHSFMLAIEGMCLLAKRYGKLAESQAHKETDPRRRGELQQIAQICHRVPAQAPRSLHEALQAYWFCHLGVITELNGWDAFSPGHLDQHLWPFYQRDLQEGQLDREGARELLECFFIKFNNHPAPPKVGVTAAESGTYTDFANINLAGLLSNGKDGSNELTDLLLEIIDEMHLLQPSSNVQISRKSPDPVLRSALRVIQKGYGFPSLFNADSVVEEQLRQGKSLEDAREGGCSGCVEVGAFGKESYILTGYFNLVKILELTLRQGFDLRTSHQLGPQTEDPLNFQSMEELFQAFEIQLSHFLEIKLRGNHRIENLYARDMPAPFLSVLIDDCLLKGRDYNAGGARYHNRYVQAVGIGSIADALAGLEYALFEPGICTWPDLLQALEDNFAPSEPLRQRLLNKAPKYGNDDDRADRWMQRVFEALFRRLDDRPSPTGGRYRLQMLPTTCHVYFGTVCGATPDGRKAGMPLSEGISPVQGRDRKGPTAVLSSAAKMDHVKTGGTLLNLKLSPALLETSSGLEAWAHLVRTYFRQDGHHIQFNVVDAESLRQAIMNPEAHRGLIVRVAGYSDYFCDLSAELQEEILSRTEHTAF